MKIQLSPRPLALAVALVLVGTACSDAAETSGIGGMSGGDFTGGAGSKTGDDGKAGGTTPAATEPKQGTGQTALKPGQLTAGDWDDNLNFGLFQKYVDAARKADLALPDLKVNGRVPIVVVDAADKPVPGARVRIFAGSDTFFDGPTGTDGRALWLPEGEGGQKPGLKVEISPPVGMSAAATTSAVPESAQWSFVLDGAAPAVAKIDIAFVFDATGSMGDEMAWLKAEIGDIVSEVKALNSQISLRLALVVYRDTGDAYVTRVFDFTEDVDKYLVDLNKQGAGGGGDYPEAMDKGLADMNQLSWREGSVARVAFVVADAPPKSHNLQAAIDQALVARAQGIRLYGLAASGTGDKAEYVLRSMAMLTGARYLFLTDDSGVGNSHAEPHIPCHYVMLLHTLMRRTIQAEISGVRVPPENDEIIKAVGNPQQGYCELKSGEKAWL